MTLTISNQNLIKLLKEIAVMVEEGNINKVIEFCIKFTHNVMSYYKACGKIEEFKKFYREFM